MVIMVTAAFVCIRMNTIRTHAIFLHIMCMRSVLLLFSSPSLLSRNKLSRPRKLAYILTDIYIYIGGFHVYKAKNLLNVHPFFSFAFLQSSLKEPSVGLNDYSEGSHNHEADNSGP